jgi:hypothetical protein
MTTLTDGVAVIATQVARTDRRALSEAWYSALHLAHANGPAQAPSRARAIRETPLARQPVPAAQPARVGTAHVAVTRAPHRDRGNVALPADERRRPACAVARRIEGAVTALRARVNGHAAQTIDVAGGRVRLLVRSDRGTTRIVALCSDELREPVERALARARFTLAGAGQACGTSS